jgi:hypothetical protein
VVGLFGSCMGAEAVQYLYVQDERYFAIEHMDVRREASRGPHMCLACPGKTIPPPQRPLVQAIAQLCSAALKPAPDIQTNQSPHAT